MILAPLAGHTTVEGTGIGVQAVQLTSLTGLVDAGGDGARVHIGALGIVVAAPWYGRINAANVGVAEIAGADIHVKAGDGLVLAQLVRAPIFGAGIAIVAVGVPQAATRNGFEEAPRDRVASVSGARVLVRA